MSYDMKKSGDRIRQLRIQHGYTRDEFSQVLGIDKSHLSRIESGKKGCSVDLLLQLSEILSVTIDYLVTGKVRSKFLELSEQAQLKSEVEDIIIRLDGVVNKRGAKWQYNEFGQQRRRKRHFWRSA